MNIMALDLGVKAGWAVSIEGQPNIAHTHSFDSPNRGARLSDFLDFLERRIVTYEIELVYVEDRLPVKARGQQTNQKAEDFIPMMRGVVELAAHRHGADFEKVAARTWRKHFLGVGVAPRSVTGSGRAWFKQQAIARCKRLGLKFDDDNSAEAQGILDYAKSRNSKAFGALSGDLFRA
ncbi:hypothetical protein ACQU0X_28845 [Pseudovibrio ascidiaceicola]|uniref:hypothetical protein n=1 Tax=Pseudovibrio ascidiaceicola TaxID=285279 RepID=UPI003D368C7B